MLHSYWFCLAESVDAEVLKYDIHKKILKCLVEVYDETGETVATILTMVKMQEEE